MKTLESVCMGISALVVAAALATPAEAVVLGANPGADDGASNNVAIGNGWTQIVGSTGAIAVGGGAKVKGQANGGVTIGNDAYIGLDAANQPGTHSTSRSTAIGANAQVQDGAYSSTALGSAAHIGFSAHESTAIGQGANIGDGSVGAVALGHGAQVGANTNFATAIGDYAKANNATSVALGRESATTRGAETNYAAFGLGTPQSSIGEVAIGVPNIGVRTLTGVAAGREAHDAVNVQQLTAVSDNVATILGGGSSLDSYGVINAPSYTIQGTAYNDIGSTFSAVDTALNHLDTEITQKAGQAGAVGLAASSLRFDGRPGKLSLAVAGGAWGGQNALAFGGGYTSMDQRVRANVTGTASGGTFGVGGGVSFTLN